MATYLLSRAFFIQGVVLLIHFADGFKVGYQYTFDYQSTILNGYYEKQYAGMQLRGQLVVYQRNVGSIVAKLTNLKAIKNGQVSGSNLFNPYDGATDALNPDIDIGGESISINNLEQLEREFTVHYKSGLFKDMSVGADEPEWVINIKKAVVSHIQMDFTGRRLDGSKLDLNYFEEPEKNIAFNYYEETSTGDCSTTVQLSEVTPAFADTHPILQESLIKNICEGERILEVMKTKDFKKCRTGGTRHFVIPALYTCNLDTQNCGMAVQGGETTKYYACGSATTGYTIVEMQAYDEFSVKPYGINTESIASYSAVTIHLKKMETLIQKEIPALDRTITSLLYTFPNDEQHGSNDATVHLLEEVAEQIKTAYEADKDTTGRLTAVRENLQHSNGEQLQELWTAVKDREVLRDLFLDALVAAGTVDTVELVKELVETEQVIGEKANWMVIAMGYFVRTPTQELLRNLLHMVKSYPVQSHDELKHISLLMLADLLSVSCDSPFLREKRFSFSLLGTPPCNPSAPVVQEFFDMLKEELRTASDDYEKFTIITALGTLGIKDVVAELVPHIRGNDDHSDTGLRTRAIFSLHRVMYSNPEYVYPLLTSIADNLEERPEVRMSAIALLLNANAPSSIWQKLAYRTWFESSRQVGAFTYNILKSMSTVPPMTPIHKEFAEKAKLALDQAMPAKFGLPFSASDMRNSWMDEGLGVITHTPQWRIADEHLPVGWGHSLWYQLGPFTSNPLQIYIWNYNMENVWNNIINRLTGSVAAPRKASLDEDASILKTIRDTLNPKPRPKDKTLGTLHLNLMGSVQRIFNLDGLDKHVGKLLGEAAGVLAKGPMKISLLKYRMLGEIDVRVPTANGMDVHFLAQAPILVSLQGELNKIDNGISANLAVVTSWKFTSELKTSLHFANDYVAAGVETRVDSHLPHVWSQVIGRDSITIGWKPSSKTTDLIRYEVLPYTIARHEDDQVPISESTMTRAVNTHLPAFQYLRKFQLLKYSGVDVELEVTSQLAHNDHEAFDEWFSKWDVNSYSNLGFVPLELDKRVYVVRFKPGSANEVKIQLRHKLIPFPYLKATVHSTDGISVASTTAHSLSTEEEDQVVLDIKKQVSGGSVKVLSLNVDALQQDGSKNTIKAKLGLSNSHGDKDLANLRVDYSSKDLTYCIRVRSTTSRNKPPVFGLSDTELYLNKEVEVDFGKTCDESHIHLIGHAKRNELAADFARNSKAGRQCKSDQAKGNLDSPSCKEAQNLDATYNIYDFNATCSNIPETLTDTVWSLVGQRVRHALYPFIISAEPANNGDNTVALLARRNPANGDVDLDIYKPKETIRARHVRGYNIRFSPLTTAYTSLLFPMNARRDFATKATTLTYAGVNQQRCYISKKQVITFDQVRYDYHMEGCDHVLLVPTNEPSRWAVLGRQQGDGSVVTIIYGSEVIILSTVTHSVSVNGNDYSESQTGHVEIVNSAGNIGTVIMANNVIKFAGKDFKISMEKNQITIKPKLHLRGRIAGVCGDYDLEVTTEFKNPDRCALTSGALMAFSYKLSTPYECLLANDLTSNLQAELQKCDSVDAIIRSALPIPKDPSKCTSYIHSKTLRDGQTCLSIEKVAQCNRNCRPAYMITKTLRFVCYSDEELKENDKPDFYTEVTIPSSCIGY